MGEDLARGDRPAPHRLPPVSATGGEVDLGHDDLCHGVEEVAFAGDMVVERRRLDSEPPTELPHGE
jgi:hypothetical protein